MTHRLRRWANIKPTLAERIVVAVTAVCKLGSSSAGNVFRRQNLPSVDVRFWRLKSISALKALTKTLMTISNWIKHFGLHDLCMRWIRWHCLSDRGFELLRSETEHAPFRPRRLPTILSIKEWAEKKRVFLCNFNARTRDKHATSDVWEPARN